MWIGEGEFVFYCHKVLLECFLQALVFSITINLTKLIKSTIRKGYIIS